MSTGALTATPKGDTEADGSEPLVTVVVPCHNQGQLVEECLRSLCSQTWRRWEAIVVDDASPDQEVLQSALRTVDDHRVRCVRHDERRGPAAARNTGVAASQAELLLFLDADDKLAPHALQRLVAALRAEAGAELAHGDVQQFARRNDVRHVVLPESAAVSREQALPIAGTLVRRALLQRIGLFDEREELARGGEDWDWSMRLVGGDAHVVRVPEPLYLQRMLHTSLGRSAQCREHRIASCLVDKHRLLLGTAARAFLAHAYQRAAIANHQQGDARLARALARHALRLHPDLTRLKTCARTLLSKRVYQGWRRGELRRAMPFVGYPLHGPARHRPFFVIGVGRSGNTLFRRILTSHSRLHVPPETFVLGACVQKWRRYGRRMTWPDLVELTLAQLEFHPEWHTFDAWLGPLVQRLVDVPSSRRNLADVLDAFYRYHAELRGVQPLRWGDKTPMNSLDDRLVRGERPRRLGMGVPETLERLRAVFPDAQFLHIVRDGCDVAYSTLRGLFMTDLEEAALRWLHVVRQNRNFTARHPGQCMELRYEDLIAHPDAVVREVCAFLEVPFEPAMLRSERLEGLGDVVTWEWHQRARQPIDPRNTGKGRQYFTRSERETLQRLLGDELATLGYPPATMVATPALETTT